MRLCGLALVPSWGAAVLRPYKSGPRWRRKACLRLAGRPYRG